MFLPSLSRTKNAILVPLPIFGRSLFGVLLSPRISSDASAVPRLSSARVPIRSQNRPLDLKETVRGTLRQLDILIYFDNFAIHTHK